MRTDEIRKKFLEFYEKKDHKIYPSAPLVPDDPTLLFTVAGMVQFKPFFAGTAEPPKRRTASCQKCLRAGGKDSDLDKVGHTVRHHTFFEMLGNFSFGDYFKEEGILWAWEFCVNVAGLNPERLYATVHVEDDEAYDIWLREVGLDETRLARYDRDNFWGPAGGVGACGPSSEIHYYLGEEHGCDRADCHINCDCDRWLELYNVVFPQFDQQPDGSRPPLANRGIDTGAGLERFAVVTQGVSSNFETDIFAPLIARVEELIEKGYKESDRTTSSMNIVADHTRALVFTLVENILPSNEGRGYVVRKILRRALLHAYLLGVNEPILHRLVEPITKGMGGAYPEIKEREKFLGTTIEDEEKKYLRTLTRGMDRLQNMLTGMKAGDMLSGSDAFTLYDTYGLPPEVTAEVAEWEGIAADMDGFDSALAEQRHRSKQASAFTVDFPLLEGLADLPATEFVGYETLTAEVTILAIITGQGRVDALAENSDGILVLDRTPFYAEAGGQVGDSGLIRGENTTFDVDETGKNQAGVYLHYGTQTTGVLQIGDKVRAAVDPHLRKSVERHHTTTHLLHTALRELLGTQATQSGSYVGGDYLRFDYASDRALEPEEVREVERRVNELIMENFEISWCDMDLEEATAKGATALFGEKYGERVRVVFVGGGEPISTELCGGTHLKRTGDAGPFYIVREEALSAGVRRVEAVAGEAAVAYAQRMRRTLDEASRAIKTGWENLTDRIERYIEENKRLTKELKSTQTRDAGARLRQFADYSTKVKGVDVLVEYQFDVSADAIKDAAGNFIAENDPVFILMATEVGDKVVFYAGASPGAISAGFHAGKVASAVSKLFGGGGGGKPDFAQGGFNITRDAGHVEELLEEETLKIMRELVGE
jgi:alanyl-tRNA synthetase